MKHTEQINDVAAGLSKFQGNVPKITHNKEVFKKGKDGKPDQKYTYADLDIIMETVRPVLAKFDLSVSQDILNITVNSMPALAIETMLMHSSGQWLKAECPIIEPKEYGYVPMQTLGALITYAKRYSICAMLGITADPDDDANDDAEIRNKAPAQLPSRQPTTVTKTSASTPKGALPNAAQGLMKIDVNGCVRLKALADSNGWTDDQLNDYLDRFMKVPMLKDLKVSEATQLANVIKNNSYDKAVTQ